METDARSLWLGAARQLISGALPHAVPDSSGFAFPGPAGRQGERVDRLEGFARVGLLMAFYVASETDDHAEEYADFLRAGMTSGVGSLDRSTRWVEPGESAQAVAEAATISLILRLTRTRVWEHLTDSTRTGLLEYFGRALDVPVWNNNWHLFRALLASAVLDLDPEAGRADLVPVRDAELALIDDWLTPDGWYSDGPGRKYDHYNSFAFHFYPVLDCWLLGDEAGLARYRDRLETFLRSYTALFDVEGPHVALGRSLIYRFAAASSLGLGALVGVQIPAAALRDRATATLSHFMAHGALVDGVLTLGWLGEDASVVQAYSGPASPYWASKAFACLLLPADHEFWTSPAQEMPVPSTTALLAHRVQRGAVAVYNHRSSDEITTADWVVEEDPLYSRLGYSNRTLPGPRSQPVLDMGVVLQGRGQRAVRGLILESDHGDGWASSVSELRLVRHLLPTRVAGRGMSRVYRTLPASLRRVRGAGTARMKACTLLDDRWAVHVIVLDPLPFAGELVVGGWRVAGSTDRRLSGRTATVEASEPTHVTAATSVLHGWNGELGFHDEEDLAGAPVTVPFARVPRTRRGGRSVAIVATTLSHDVGVPLPPTPEVLVDGSVVTVVLGAGGRHRLDVSGARLIPVPG